MGWRKVGFMLALVAALGALGCGKSTSSGVSISIAAATGSVVTNQTDSISANVSGSSNQAVNWTVTCATGVTAGTCGTITSPTTSNSVAAVYTAPATVPTTTSNGTTTPAPTVTITGTSQADSTKTASTTITVISGITVSITQTTATVGTGETFTFSATVTNPGCNTTSNPNCLNVTWSVPSSTTSPNPDGSIGSTTGVYTAPSTVPTPSVVTITATSVADTAVTATASVTVETATTPTVTSVSPNSTALGALFQDVYITGTNFISTNKVYVNGALLDPTLFSEDSSSLIRARIPDFMLAAPPPSNIFQISVSKQSGSLQTCTNASQCQIVVKPVRPGVVGPAPDSIPQGSGVLSFTVDGGFFGAGANPAVTATYNGQVRTLQLPATGATNSTRQMSVSIGGVGTSDFSVPGLYPVAVRNAADPAKLAVTNLAVQPNYTTPASTRIPVGSAAASAPTDVAVNPATGVAVVANQGSNDITLIDLTANTPAFIANICTAAVGLTPPCPTTNPSGPNSVSIYYNFNNGAVIDEAVVVNSTAKTIAVVDLSAQKVTFVTAPLQDTPGAVGINPVTGRALVAMQTTNYGILLDLTQNPPAQIGVVTISTGPGTRVAVEPRLNWAIATPGGQGSLGIVDLNRQSSNPITTLSRTSNVVTVTVQSGTSALPLAVHLGDAVLIQNVNIPGDSSAATSFDGVYTVSALGPSSAQFSYSQSTTSSLSDVPSQAATGTVNYSQALTPPPGITSSLKGIGINTETQQAVLVDPATNGVVYFFSVIDQTVTATLALKPNGVAAKNGPTAAAYNPLTNTIVAVNSLTNTLSVIAPPTSAAKAQSLNDLNPFTTLATPVAVAIDPGSNQAVVANQGDNSVSVLALGSIRPFSIAETSPKTIVTNSTLASSPSPSAQTITVIGQGLSCAVNPTVRLDGAALQTFCNASDKNRVLTAIAPPSVLAAAHRYALDVADSSGNVTNAEDLTVEQSIDMSTACATTPYPSGVAIDPVQNIAAVSLFGCNAVALIDMNTSTGRPVTVGTNPIGVAVIPRLAVAVVANNGSGNASIVDELQQTVTHTVTTASGSQGAAADQDTAEVAIANTTANSVTVVNAATFGTHSISTGSSPVAVAFNYVNHEVAVAAAGSDYMAVGDAGGGSTATTFGVSLPTSVAYDPVPSDCAQISGGTTSNTAGCFLVNSSSTDALEIIDPIAFVQTQFRMGINPTAIAYNFLTSTAVSTNTTSHTLTVADLPRRQVRSVLPLPPAQTTSSLIASGLPQFALDIHPFTNVAVVADTANGRVLFIPLPH